MTQFFDLDEVQRILELVRQHELAEFELEHQGLKIRIRKDTSGNLSVTGQSPVASPATSRSNNQGAAPNSAHPTPETEPLPEAAVADDGVELAVVKSPIVGTFYRAAEPGAPPFVEIGETVKKGQVLCIIEAMKLMNEIESEYDGQVTNAYAENGQPVQYGERLFAIRTG